MPKQLNSNEPNNLLIGLGGTGGKVLKAIRKRIFREFPNEKDRENLSIGYVYVDSTREMMSQNDPSFRVLGNDASFKESEFVDIKSVDLSTVLSNVQNYPGLAGVVKNGESMRRTLGEVGKAAGQKRRAGRILFAANAQKYKSALNNQYEKVKKITRQDKVTLHIFTGLAGGTGSGSIIDVVAQTRAMDQFRDARIIVYAMVPELSIPTGCQAGRYHQNGYAALRELNALNISHFLPYDVITGDEHVRLNPDPLKQFTLMLYSNVNENGVVVNSFSELPELLGDFVYNIMFHQEINGVNDDVMRSINAENYNDFTVEYSEKSKNHDKERARTKALSTFGIKRIVYPEQRIQEHVTYTVGKKIMLQMQYNNFVDDIGFIAEAPQKDYAELYIKDENLIKWHLSDEHLQLQKKILDTDKYISTFDEYWQETSYFDNYDTAKSFGDNPLVYLQNSCQRAFDTAFRNKKGVAEYYKDKADNELLTQMAVSIVEQIEKSLYTQWYEGTLSLYDLLSICETVLAYIDRRYKGIDGEIGEKEELVKKRTKRADDNLLEYNDLNPVQRLMGKGARLYADHQVIMKKLYTAKTEVVALEFEKRILSRLKMVFTDFHDQVQAFVGRIMAAVEMLDSAVADRATKGNSLDNMVQNVIEVCEDDKMALFERNLIQNKGAQTRLSTSLRQLFVGNRSFAHFDELARELSPEAIFDILDTQLTPHILTIHDEEMKKDKILGINVLRQLQKVLPDQAAIDRFARDIVQQSGTFLKLDDTELSKALNNNPNPVAQPESMNRKSVLINMPSDDGDESLKEFSEKLKTAIREAFGHSTAGTKLQFATIPDCKNEINIMSMRYCFPMRAISWLKTYDDEYKRMINSPNEAEARDARILLHSEGDGQSLPEIMGEPKLSPADFGAYLFLAAALNILEIGEDAQENRGWCYMEEDEWGSKIPHLVAERFTGILTSDELTPALMDDVKDKVVDYFKNPELKRSQREAVVENIKGLMRNYVSKEATSTTSPVYQKHSDYARKALELAMNLK